MRKPRHQPAERPIGRSPGILGLCALGIFTGCSEPSAPDADIERDRYNVVLISLDSTRRDLLSSYGHRPKGAPEEPSSPRLDRMAAEGVLMEDAYSTTSWTLPAHVSLLTGVPELVHGVDFDTHEPDPDRLTLAQVLRRAGYRTTGYFSGPYLDAHFGFDRGFEIYEPRYGSGMEEASRQMAAANRKLARIEARGDPAQTRQAKARSAQALEQLQAQSRLDVSSRSVTDAALEELDRAAADERPFFLFAHYFDPHYDYLPPAPHDKFDPEYDGNIDGTDFYYGQHISLPDPEHPGKRIRVVSERDLDHLWALYAGELAWTDAEVGRILDRLDELGLGERTLVIVTADHGDEFFEHGSIGHRLNLYEESVQVPMILRLPGLLPAGERVEGVVSTADIYPSILDLLGIDAQASAASQSFLPLVFGQGGDADRYALGRIVAMNRSPIQLPGKEREIDALLVQVIETFRSGSIKITRERSWKKPVRPVPDKWQEEVEQARRRDAARERLVWIDIEQHPGELPEHESSDFTGAGPRGALEKFRQVYARLLTMRGGGELRDADDDMLAQLRGLGYASADVGSDPITRDEFLLPPPGERLPR